jgi:leucyl/phenylalanyl-tRNA--protein transferase
VLLPGELHVSRRLERTLRQGRFSFTMDRSFEAVVRSCAGARRPGQPGTWITGPMIRAYTDLHRAGFAHSVEAWREGRLAGGLYGVRLGRCFFGESMFSVERDASKAAFVRLVRHLERRGFVMVDCQVATRHLMRFGAREVPRSAFLRLLEKALELPASVRGLEPGLSEGFEFSKRPETCRNGRSDPEAALP